jgi:hypothetical protein
LPRKLAKPLLKIYTNLGLQRNRFFPFKRIGLAGIATAREVAFTAIRGDRVIIFIDASRTVDQAVFDICHELSHILLDHDDPMDEDERLCDLVAQELVYPKKFIATAPLVSFLDAKKYTWTQVMEQFQNLNRELNWSPKGLGVVLSVRGLIKKGSHELKRLMAIGKVFDQSQRSFEELLFNRFVTDDFDKLVEFFKDDLQKNKPILLPMITLKNAAAFGHLGYRKLAELFGMNSGDADELVRIWRSEQEEGQENHAAEA